MPTLEIDGKIYEVDDIKQKIISAKKQKADIFLVPQNNYQEALKNALSYAKDDVRRSFKEDDFCNFDNGNYVSYVKERTRSFISTVHFYLSTYYTSFESIVDLKDKFKNLNVERIEMINFDVYNNAKSVQKKSREKISELKEKLKSDIDGFVSNSRSH